MQGASVYQGEVMEDFSGADFRPTAAAQEAINATLRQSLAALASHTEHEYRKAALTGLLSNVALMQDVGLAVQESVVEKRTHSEDAMRRWEQVVAEMAFRVAAAMMEMETQP